MHAQALLIFLCSPHVLGQAALAHVPRNEQSAKRTDIALPKVIGIVGVGTIGSAVARGLLSAPAGQLPFVPEFILSPRTAAKAAALKADFPTKVSVAVDDQGVVDGADCVILALPAGVAVNVVKTLRFRPTQQVVSLVAGMKFAQLEDIVRPATNCTMALPLPAVAKQQGTTPGFPPTDFADAIFSSMGSYIAIADEQQFNTIGTIGAFMGDFYKRQLTMQQWLISHGTDPTTAATYIGSLFSTIAADSKEAGPDTFQEKVAEQTPGGLNEMVWKQQEAAGVYAAVNRSLDAVFNHKSLVPSSGIDKDVVIM